MELIVLGSGGANKFPRPFCHCKICDRARERGVPYARTSAALFVKDEQILFDTPEEITCQIERENLVGLKHIFFTHWHPDHTQGIRIVEHINYTGYDEKGVFEREREKINVYLPENMVDDFNRYVRFIKFFEERGWIKVNIIHDRKPVKIGSVTVTPLDFYRPDRVRYGFLIEKGGKRGVYMPCSIFGAKTDSYYESADVLLLETGWPGNTAEIREKSGDKGPFKDHASFEEDAALVRKLKPKRAVFTHIEASSHADYETVSEQIKKAGLMNAEVAFDGMRITV